MADSWCLKTRRRKENQSLKPGFQYFSTLIIHIYGNFCILSFFFLLFEFISLECPVGYRGSGCIFKCEPPTYGPNCVETCHCTKDQCDNQFGCKISSNSGIITLPYVYDSRTNVKYDIYSILFNTTLADCMNPFR